MKANVIKTIIDHETIHTLVLRAITESLNPKYNPYIFMNKATADRIGRTVPEKVYVNSNSNQGYFYKYEGYRVFLNDDLDYGEIEIR